MDEDGARAPDITRILDEVVMRRLTRDELRKIVRKKAVEIEEEIKEKRIREAEKSMPTISPEVKLETPEDYERAAQVLLEKAKELKTPKQEAREKLEEVRKRIDKVEQIMDVTEYRTTEKLI